MGKIVDDLIDRIQKAFGGIKLADGISLNMTEYYDSYESMPEYLEKAKFDERCDWTAIPGNTLEKFTVTFCFTDAAGFRFYLPAYMIHALRNPETCDDTVIYALNIDYHTFNEMVLNNVFTHEQMSCIVGFLEYCSSDDADYDATVAKANLAKLKKALKWSK